MYIPRFVISIRDHLVLLHLLVQLRLQCAHLYLHYFLDFIGQLRLDVLFQATKQEGP
jgi:hypothetical protein